MSRSWRVHTSCWRSSTIRMSSRLSMSSMTMAESRLVLRREVEQVCDKDEPEESEAGERKNGCIEFVPDCPALTEPGVDCVIKDHHSTHRAQNADEVSEVNPFVQAIIECGDVRQPVYHDRRNAGDEENVERDDDFDSE